jgi:DNA-directed RNA polymerase subunit N (RpoN/RPB10)
MKPEICIMTSDALYCVRRTFMKPVSTVLLATKKNVKMRDTRLLCLDVTVPFRCLYCGQGLNVTWKCGTALPTLNLTSKLCAD